MSGRKAFDFSGVEHLLGKIPDVEIADQLGCCEGLVQSKRLKAGIKYKRGRKHGSYNKPPPWLKLIGIKTDAEISRKFGITTQAAQLRRKQAGIPPAPNSRFVDWSKVDHLLGTVTDVEIATIIKRDSAVVGKRRRKLGIAVFDRRTKKGK